MLVRLAPNSTLVLRSSDWRALVAGKDYAQEPGSRVLVLGDDASSDEIIRAGGGTEAPPVPPT